MVMVIKAAFLLIKLMALSFIMFLSFVVTAPLMGDGLPPTPEQASAAKVLFIVNICFAVALSYPIIRSRWHGWKLVAAVFFIFYGIMTFMSQIETAYFLRMAPLLPPGMLPKLFLAGAIIAGLWSPLAVLILGKFRRQTFEYTPNPRLVMPFGEWAWKLTLIITLYLILYFGFGYFVAWQNPDLRSYYGGTDPGSLLAQMKTVAQNTPGLILLQFIRALLWTALAVPVVRMLKGPWWEAGIAVSLLFTVLMGFQLLIPNPYMPATVRISHFVEVSASNFLFGWLMVWVLGKRIPRDISPTARPTCWSNK